MQRPSRQRAAATPVLLHTRKTSAASARVILVNLSNDSSAFCEQQGTVKIFPGRFTAFLAEIPNNSGYLVAMRL